jgi:adenylate cyclase
LSKPFARQDLMKYSVGDLSIDTGRQLVMRAAGQIPLPKLSYDLLLVLVRAAPNLVSVEELMRLVWPGVVVGPETVSQRVKMLRDVLDDDPKTPRYIQGLRGRGYQILATVTENSGTPAANPSAPPATKSVAVLPFLDMSETKDQEYFADGITEDIITGLSKVSALATVSRNSSFMYKGHSVDILKVARELQVSHILEGSVRKAGQRVRITAQLIDGSSNAHIWAERYDRDLNDIFAIQDEISESIVAALKLRLLPSERRAIQQRGTDNIEAYNLYLLARQLYVTGHEGDARRAEGIVRLCAGATEIDPQFGRAWALLGLGQVILRFMRGADFNNGLQATERALELDARNAEAHAIKARILSEDGHHEAASTAIDAALRLDPESYEVNRSAGYLRYREHRPEDAGRYFEKAMTLVESDINSANMLISCYCAVGDAEAVARVSRIGLSRAERILAQDPNNATAIQYGANALAALGQATQFKDWMHRALLIDPDNIKSRFNFACALVRLQDNDAALELLQAVFEKMAIGLLNHAKADPDLDPIRGHPKFKGMVEAAERRLTPQRTADVAVKSGSA